MQFSGFHRKSLLERSQVLKAIYPELDDSLNKGGLELRTADLMIENCIGLLNLPVGLGLNARINDTQYVVPMCVEEPSIIAAACSASKLISECGGFHAMSSPPIMRGQIQLTDVDSKAACFKVLQHKKQLIDKANSEYCYRMTSRGGGVENLECRALSPDMAVVELFVNVCDAMGANLINSLCESISRDILHILKQGDLGLRILSNYCTERRVTASFAVPVNRLNTKGIDGITIARKIIDAYRLADLDVYRAVTHNKGIMNGIDAVAVATGQDFRAIEAATHAWAARSGVYKPITEYWIEKESVLHARIELPLAIGVHGGVLKTNQVYQGNLHMMGNPSARKLSEIMASIGLACNFAAIRAMVSEGIQKGHMSLHARNIAISAGVPNELVSEVVEYMKQRNEINEEAAKNYLIAHNLNLSTKIRPSIQGTLSTFSIHIEETNPPLKLDIAFESIGMPIHLAIDKRSRELSGEAREIYKKFLNTKHGYDWTLNFWNLLDRVKFEPNLPRTNLAKRIKLKLIGIWMRIISNKLIAYWNIEMVGMCLDLIFKCKDDQLFSMLRASSEIPQIVTYPVCLLREMWNIFRHHIEEWKSSVVSNSEELASAVLEELETIIRSNVQTAMNLQKKVPFVELLEPKSKQMCATLMYLIDYLGADVIDPSFIVQRKTMGRMLECISVGLRDMASYKKNEHSPANVFKYWLEFNPQPDPKKYIQDILNHTSKWNDVLDENNRQIMRSACKALEEYFHVSPKL